MIIMKKLLSGWNVMRVIRLLIGVYAFWQAIITKEPMLGLAGLFIAAMALANMGCCGINGCQIISSKPVLKEKISYEEVDGSK
jgi:hypothetical protein